MRSHRFAAWAAAALLAVRAAAAAPPTWAVAVLPSGSEYALEVAADESARQRGYMFRSSVGRRDGMLFVFPASGRHGFWMKNCRVRLDIIWLDDGFRVVHIAHDQAPCPSAGPCPTIEPARSARFVIELAGGTARAERLTPGDTIVVLSEPVIR